jgi:hypothetical protein
MLAATSCVIDLFLMILVWDKMLRGRSGSPISGRALLLGHCFWKATHSTTPYPFISGVFMNIFVGNLSCDISEEELRTAFSAFGQVSKVTILKDKFSGEPRGFGFIEMPARAEARAAINGMNQKELKGHALNVNEARPPSERPGGGGMRLLGKPRWPR